MLSTRFEYTGGSIHRLRFAMRQARERPAAKIKKAHPDFSERARSNP